MITLRKGSHRNTQCHIIGLHGATFYFSYQTCIAIRCAEGQFRVHNSWGPTTGRHISDMDVRGFKEVGDNEFACICERAISVQTCVQCEHIERTRDRVEHGID